MQEIDCSTGFFFLLVECWASHKHQARRIDRSSSQVPRLLGCDLPSVVFLDNCPEDNCSRSSDCGPTLGTYWLSRQMNRLAILVLHFCWIPICILFHGRIISKDDGKHFKPLAIKTSICGCQGVNTCSQTEWCERRSTTSNSAVNLCRKVLVKLSKLLSMEWRYDLSSVSSVSSCHSFMWQSIWQRE